MVYGHQTKTEAEEEVIDRSPLYSAVRHGAHKIQARRYLDIKKPLSHSCRVVESSRQLTIQERMSLHGVSVAFGRSPRLLWWTISITDNWPTFLATQQRLVFVHGVHERLLSILILAGCRFCFLIPIFPQLDLVLSIHTPLLGLRK